MNRNKYPTTAEIDDAWAARISANSACFAEWDCRLASENLPSDIPLIPREFRGLTRRRRFCDNSALAEIELAQPWGSQRVNKGPSVRDGLARQAALKIEVNHLTGLDAEVWQLYCAGIPERAIAKKLGRSLRFIYERHLGPLLARFALPHRKFPIKHRFNKKGNKKAK